MSIPSVACGATDEVADHCLNCGQFFGPARPLYCPACGQETRHRPPTLGEFVQQFGGAFLSTEGALWRTLKLLLLKPGELTRQYLSGRRKHYVLPLRLYLTVSVVTLLVMRLLASLSVSTSLANADGFDPQRAAQFTIALGPSRLGMQDGRFYCENLPRPVCARLGSRIDLDARGFQREADRFGERFVSNLGAAMFVILPSLAMWLTAFYRNRNMRYTENLVFALHLHSFWFIALALLLPGIGWLSAIGLVAIPVYSWLAVKRVYGGGAWPRLLRLTLVSILYALTLTLAMAGIGVWSLLT